MPLPGNAVLRRYAVATLVPLLALCVAALLWPGAAYVALIWLTVLVAALDAALSPPARPAEADADGQDALWADRLCLGLGVGHLLVLPLVVLALSQGGMSVGAWVALLLATASFAGQVSHPNAHELIHRPSRPLRGIGAAVYTTVAFGHHVSAHRLVHHAHVGTPEDPNTPLPGENFWAYLPRAWAGSFRAGLQVEEARLERQGQAPRGLRNPYAIWIGGAAAMLLATVFLAGPLGGLILLILWGLTGAQILMSDYLQHYGLQRLERPDGRLEPLGRHHSWNAPKGFSSYLMMNAPAHSEHHMHPDRPYDRLDPQAEAPTLPYAMPIMAMLACVPAVWHRVMDRRALRVMEAAQARLMAGDRGARPAPGASDVQAAVRSHRLGAERQRRRGGTAPEDAVSPAPDAGHVGRTRGETGDTQPVAFAGDISDVDRDARRGPGTASARDLAVTSGAGLAPGKTAEPSVARHTVGDARRGDPQPKGPGTAPEPRDPTEALLARVTQASR